ncbi:NAD(+) kinase [Campylobacter sputorum]|uniref:NAD(+) kinase n=1 Tax=Campylobacter sputorum TaxID=206 RepID=UPI00053C04EF|nr:NAD(+) kinase [Campylobacter sputorum]
MEKEKINHKNIKNIGIVAKNHENIKQNIHHISQILNLYGVNIILETESAKLLNLKGQSLLKLAKTCDMIISLGGDGTLLGVCRKIVDFNTPIIGIYAGNLGFLTDVNMANTKEFFADFFDGKFEIQRTYLLDINLKKDEKILNKIAFNDVVLVRSKIKSIAKIEAFFHDKHFNSYFGDGVIVSSPIGSTAYNMSAGGSIIYPLCNVFSITPICSHSLTQRSLILPKDAEISFKSRDNVVVVIDGQDVYEMSDYDEVIVKLSDKRVNLIKSVKTDYFDILKEKLRWGHND